MRRTRWASTFGTTLERRCFGMRCTGASERHRSHDGVRTAKHHSHHAAHRPRAARGRLRVGSGQGRLLGRHRRRLQRTYVGGAGNQFVMAAHSTTRSGAIGTSFVAPMNDTIRTSERIAPTIANTLYQPNGTHHPTTARAARINTPAVVTARKNPATGKPEIAIRPNSPPSPIDHGKAHLSRPPKVLWASLSRE